MPVAVRRVVLALALALASGCAATRAGGTRAAAPPRVAPEDAARDALADFVSAVDAGRWSDAYALLSARWRGRLTPARLARDYEAAGAVGRGAAARARALLAARAPMAVNGSTATLEVGGGKAAALVEEQGAWKVDALE